MNAKLKRETIVKDAWVAEPISEEAVHKAYDIFRSQYIDSPSTLVMHPEVRYVFLEQLKTLPMRPDKYMGMDLEVDSDFDEHEWCVRLSKSKTYAVE